MVAQKTHDKVVPGSIPIDVHIMLDGCRRMTSQVVLRKDLLYVMINAPIDMYIIKKTTKSDGQTLK